MEAGRSSRNTAVKLNRRRLRLGGSSFDLPFFLIVMVLLVIGIIMMFSASYAWAVQKGFEGTYYAERQIKFAVIGIVLMIILSMVDYHIFDNKFVALGLYGAGIVLLILVLVMGSDEGGSQRWLVIAGINFQPSEIVKFAVSICFSFMVAKIGETNMKKARYGIFPFLTMLAVVALLMMMQPHLSGTLIICMIGIVIIFVGGARKRHLAVLIVLGVAALTAIVVYKSIVEDYGYFQKRIQSWRDPFSDVNDTTWQTCQSLIAIGSGGLFGLGLGESRQKYLYLPESQNDFVFAIVCEELGFIGAVTIIMLFMLFVFRGIYIASKAPDTFGMLITIGMTAQIGIQAFLNIAVVSNTIPNTGIGLPFFSYGGTSLVMLLAQTGIVLNVSRQSLIEK